MSDALTSTDQRRVMLISMLDLLHCCCNNYNARLACLEWFCAGWRHSSLVQVSKYTRAYGSQLSPTQPVFGVLQGFILSPPLFVSWVLAHHGLVLRQYADDCQVYTSTPVIDATAMADRFSHCLDDVEVWLSLSWLWLNTAKMQVLWLGSKYRCWSLMFTTFQSWQHPSESSTEHVILEWWSTID